MKRVLREQLHELERQHPGAMVLVLDAAGNYVYVNDKCRQLLGYEPKEMIGRSALEFAAPADVAHSAAALEDAALNGESVTVNIHVRTKSGELRPVRGGAQRFDDDDQFYMIGWVARV